MLLIKELNKALPARAEAARARSLRTCSETAAPKAGFSCFVSGSGAVFVVCVWRFFWEHPAFAFALTRLAIPLSFAFCFNCCMTHRA